MSNGDVIALQHNAGPHSLLRCQSSPNSPWRQPVLALNQSEWFWINDVRWSRNAFAKDDADPLPDPELDVKVLVEDGEGSWLKDVVCPIRVLYVGHSETQLQGAQLSSGLPQPGLYSMLVRHQSSLSYPSMHPNIVVSIKKCTGYRNLFRYLHLFLKIAQTEKPTSIKSCCIYVI